MAYEKWIIEEALKKYGSSTKAAAALGIDVAFDLSGVYVYYNGGWLI